MLDPVSMPVVVRPGEDGLVGIQHEVVRGIAAGMGRNLPVVVMQHPNEVEELVGLPVRFADVSGSIGMGLGQQHPGRVVSVGEELHAADPKARTEGLTWFVVAEPDHWTSVPSR